MVWKGETWMKFFNRKRLLSIVIAITVALGITVLLNIMQRSNQSISENEVRSQLEQMYGAEVADISMSQDVYKAVIRKSGSAYLVEMNPITGNINSLEQTDEDVIKEYSSLPEKSEENVTEETLEISEEPLVKGTDEINSMTKVETVKPPTKIIVTEKPKNSSTDSKKTEKPKATEPSSPKEVKSSQIKIEEKAVEEKEEKPIKEVIKDAIKDVLKPESTKTEDGKEDKPKDEGTKSEVAKTEVPKQDAVKEETVKSETAKTDDTKVEEPQVTVAQTTTSQTDGKKTDVESKGEKATTILISEEQAIKTAQQQVKGTVESSSFVKTNEGGYYLIMMKASVSENDSKDSSKPKQTKATIQVHAISGKILSVTWG